MKINGIRVNSFILSTSSHYISLTCQEFYVNNGQTYSIQNSGQQVPVLPILIPASVSSLSPIKSKTNMCNFQVVKIRYALVRCSMLLYLFLGVSPTCIAYPLVLDSEQQCTPPCSHQCGSFHLFHISQVNRPSSFHPPICPWLHLLV